MIQMVVFFAAVAILIAGSVYQRQNIAVKKPAPTSIVKPSPSPSPSLTPPPTISSAVTPVVSPSASVPTLDLKNFIYPDATKTNLQTRSLTQESSANPDAITDWYKTKISSLKYSARSFVSTRSNEKVLNKLSASDGQNEVSVTISQDTSASPVLISVTVK